MCARPAVMTHLSPCDELPSFPRGTRVIPSCKLLLSPGAHQNRTSVVQGSHVVSEPRVALLLGTRSRKQGKDGDDLSKPEHNFKSPLIIAP